MSTSAARHPLSPSTEKSRFETAYVWSVNQAVEAGQAGLAAELAASYAEERYQRFEAAGEMTGPHAVVASPSLARRRSRAFQASRRYLTQVFNPSEEVAPRSHSRGPLGY